MPEPEPEPESTNDALAFARRLFAQDCRFLAGAATLDALPETGLPEVAFAGRSNVGKSSLLNALTGRASLARISRTPGRTQQINVFDLGGRLILADLPGYGYAKASKRAVAAWTRLVDAYLRGRANLRRLCLLIDARIGPKASDRDLMERLDAAGVSYQVVLTKADKVPDEELAKRVTAMRGEVSRHAAAHPEIVVTSALKRRGIDELRVALAGLAADAGRSSRFPLRSAP